MFSDAAVGTAAVDALLAGGDDTWGAGDALVELAMFSQVGRPCGWDGDTHTTTLSLTPTLTDTHTSRTQPLRVWPGGLRRLYSQMLDLFATGVVREVLHLAWVDGEHEPGGTLPSTLCLFEYR